MRLPNGPQKQSFLYRRTIEWIFRPLEFLETYAQRYGDPFTIGGDKFPPAIYFSHPEAIQQIFSADPEVFHSGSGNRILLPIVGDNSLLLVDGDRHLLRAATTVDASLSWGTNAYLWQADL